MPRTCYREPSMMNILTILILWISQTCIVFGAGKLARYVYNCNTGESGNAFERTWNSKYLLANCEQQFMCSRDFFPYLSSHTHRYLIEDYFLPGTVFYLQLSPQDPYATPEIRALTSFALSMNRTLKDYVLVHMSDTLWQHSVIYTQFYNEWRYVLRNFYYDNPVLRKEFASGQLSYFPLGYSHHLPKDPHIQNPIAIRDKTHLVAFVGNRKTGNRLRDLQLKEVEEHIGGSVGGVLHWAGFGHGSFRDYRRIMTDAKFCLMLPSRHIENHRLYDSLESGCIPVFIDRYNSTDFKRETAEQLQPLLDMPWVDTNRQRILRAGSKSVYPEVTTTTTTTNTKDIDKEGVIIVTERVEVVVSTPKQSQSEAIAAAVVGTTAGTPAGTTVIASTSYQPFNNGGKGVSIVPFVYVATVMDFVRVLTELQANLTVMERVQQETTQWWQQVKQYYQRTVENRLCVAARAHNHASIRHN